MASKKKSIQSSEQGGKCVHVSQNLNELCECKKQMEKKFQDFKLLTGDIFKEQLTDQTKKLKSLNESLLRENFKLKRDLETQKNLHANVVKQFAVHDTLIEKQKNGIADLQLMVKNIVDNKTDSMSENGEISSRNDRLNSALDQLQLNMLEVQRRGQQLEEQ